MEWSVVMPRRRDRGCAGKRVMYLERVLEEDKKEIY